VKNVGRTVQAQRIDQTSLTGVLKEVTEATITLEYTEGKGKKAVVHQTSIPFTELHSVTVQIIF